MTDNEDEYAVPVVEAILLITWTVAVLAFVLLVSR